MDGIELRLLGPLEVVVDGRVIDVPRGRRVRALLAALALSCGRPVPVETLVEYLWGIDGAPQTARQALQNTVWRLRRLLGPQAVRAAGEAYLLDAAPDAVDAIRFSRLLDEAASSDAAERELLVEAAALWRGEPLGGVESETLRRDVVPALTERYLTAVERRIDLDLDAGTRDGLIAELRDLTAHHPLRESLWARLLTALAAAGRDADALETYDQLRHYLSDQLGADPSAELRELHQQLLTGRPAAAVPAAAREPAGSAGKAVPRQLPADQSGFVGRTDQLDALDALLEVERSSPLTVVVHGPGGVGKTAFAVRWGHRVADRFPGGQFYLDLRGYGPTALVTAYDALGSLLRAAGVEPRAIPHDADERTGLWRTTTAGRRVFLLLDNAREPEQLRPLLPSTHAVAVVTSRSQLRGLTRRDGAVSLPLRHLHGDEAHELLAGTVGASRVRQEAAAADEFVELCGGLPLALRIAADLAERQSSSSLAELVGTLRAHRLETLADPDDPAADPRTVFSWSYRTLEPELARVFRLLSLHPGVGFSAAAAAGLVGVPVAQVSRSLDRLAASHLLEPLGPHRYRFHDLIREYATERATNDDPPATRDAAARRMLDWYLQSANQVHHALRLGPSLEVMAPADPALEPMRFADQSAALAWFQTELSTLVTVARYAADHRHPAHAQQLQHVLTAPCELTQRVDDWLALGEASYHAAQSLDTTARYRAAHGLGVALNGLGRLEEAGRYKREALGHARALGAPRSLVSALTSLGVHHERLGEWRAAIDQWQEALRIARAADLPFQAAHCLLNIGSEEMNHGLHEEAIPHTEEALAAYTKLDATFHQGMALANLADAYARSGRLDEAVAHCDEAVRVFGGTEGGAPPLAFAVDMTTVYANAGHRDRARAVLRRSLDMLRGGDHPRLAEAERLLASLTG